MRKSFKLENLDCANCAAKMEAGINELPGVNKASISFMTSKLMIDADAADEEALAAIVDAAQAVCTSYEKDCRIRPLGFPMNPKQKKLLTRIIVALVLFVIIEVAAQTGILRRRPSAPPGRPCYARVRVVPHPLPHRRLRRHRRALRGLVHGHALDEDFLMTVATFGAFALVLFPDTEPHMAEARP